MQPLKPEEERAILENSPQAEPGDLQEYQRLLSLRFTEDPDQEPAAAPSGVVARTLTADSRANRELRIQELHRKLFGSAANKAASASKSAARG
jgi:hypothetical protein